MVVNFAGEPRFDTKSAALSKFTQQVLILRAAAERLGSSLFDIQRLVQADVFDSELDSANELAKRGFLRAAGAVAGVVLEKHLGQVCRGHDVEVKKKDPHICDFNDLLKREEVIETPTWRFIQRLGDLRNICDHDKKREPTKDEVVELISGVAKVMKTVF